MICIIYNCQEIAKQPFPGHNIDHGVYWRDIKQALKDYQNGKWNIFPIKDLSINELEYYANKL